MRFRRSAYHQRVVYLVLAYKQYFGTPTRSGNGIVEGELGFIQGGDCGNFEDMVVLAAVHCYVISLTGNWSTASGRVLERVPGQKLESKTDCNQLSDKTSLKPYLK